MDSTVAKDQRVMHRIVAGALFDFLGKASSGPAPVIRGDMVPVVEYLREWSARSGLNLDEADVENWARGLS